MAAPAGAQRVSWKRRAESLWAEAAIDQHGSCRLRPCSRNRSLCELPASSGRNGVFPLAPSPRLQFEPAGLEIQGRLGLWHEHVLRATCLVDHTWERVRSDEAGHLVWRAVSVRRRVRPKASPCCPSALQRLPGMAQAPGSKRL